MWNPVQRSRSITGGAAFAVAIACPTGLESALGSAASAATTRTGAAAGDGGVSSFYRFRGRLPQKPGLLIQTEPLAESLSLSGAAGGLRILYTSTDGMTGAGIAVSGALFLPKGEAPAGGWPLIAWAHGTVGIADVCAPSWAGRDTRDVTYLNHWLSQGYAIVATDYQGLGTPGPHPYLLTRAAAMSVLDSVRAVQRAAYGLSKKTMIIGQSQGGGAAFAAASTARFYAPELDIRGTVATGTPYFDLRREDPSPATRNPDAVDPTIGFNLLLVHTVEQMDSSFPASELLTSKGIEWLQAHRTGCYSDLAAKGVKAGLTLNTIFKSDSFKSRHFFRIYPEIAYPTLRASAPVFLGIGGRDRAVPPEGQTRLFKEACTAGSVVEAHVYPEHDHFSTVNRSVTESTPFVRAAFAGTAITGNCGETL